MNVLHLISSGGMYGAEAVILNLSKELSLSQRGTAVVAAFAHAGQPAPALHEAALRNEVHAVLVPCRGQADLTVLDTIRQTAERSGAEIVHAHGYKADIYAWLSWRGRKSRPALVSTCHNWIDSNLTVKAYGAVDRWALRRFDQVVAVSEQVKDRLVRSGVSEGKIRLIQNGILMAPFDAARTAGQRQTDRRGLRVGLVGRLGPEKGIDVFLRAAERVAPEFPDTEFVVAGEGPMRVALESLIRELGLEGRARLIGSQTDMPTFYASLDLLVSASHYEGLPMALLEGMASGLPVIATEVGQVPEVVAKQRTGILVPPADPNALARAMRELLGDTTRRVAFGVAGRERVTERFSAERMTTEYVEVYRRALSVQKPPVDSTAKVHD